MRPATGSGGKREMKANETMVFVAFFGFFTMDKGKEKQVWRKIIAGLVTNIEFLIALVGFSTALFELAWDLTHGGE